MKTNNKYLGLVTKKFNDFFLVDLKNQENFGNSERFLCKVRKSINFKDQLIYVGDEVVIDNIDLKSKSAVITSLKERKNLLVRPSVANISNIYITFSVKESLTEKVIYMFEIFATEAVSYTHLTLPTILLV